jgi:hypothetical protein
MLKKLCAATLIVLLGFALIACEQEGPAEEAGEKVDEAVEEASEKVEEAGEAVEEKAEETKESVKEATD